MLSFFSCCLKPAGYQPMAQTPTAPTPTTRNPYVLTTAHLIPSEIHIQGWLTASARSDPSLSDCPIKLFVPAIRAHTTHGQTILASYAPDIVASIARSSTPVQRHAIVQNLWRECHVRRVRAQRWRAYAEVFQRLRLRDELDPPQIISWRRIERLFDDDFQVNRLLEERLQQIRESFESRIAEERAAEAIEGFDELWRAGRSAPVSRS